MAKYIWKSGFPRPKVEAEVFGREIEHLTQEIDRPPKPEDIVERAQSRRSPIHAAFNWDDASAAQAHRLSQAADYLRGLLLVRVRTRDGQTTQGRAFYAVKDSRGRGYLSSDHVFSDSDLAAQVVEKAKSELESFIARYQHILAMRAVIPHLEEAISTIQGEIEELKQASEQRRVSRRKPAAERRVSA